MASDDQRFPWEPIEPEGNTEDSNDTPQEPTPAPSPFEPPTTTSSMPWVGQEWTPPAERRAAPQQEPTPTGQIPLARTPRADAPWAPFTEQASMSRFASGELPTSAPQATPPAPEVLGASAPATPLAPWASTHVPAPAPEAQQPAQSVAPPSPPTGYEPPVHPDQSASPAAPEAPAAEPRREPFTGAIPYVPRQEAVPRESLGTRAARRAAAEQPAVSPFARPEPAPASAPLDPEPAAPVDAFQPPADQPMQAEPAPAPMPPPAAYEPRFEPATPAPISRAEAEPEAAAPDMTPAPEPMPEPEATAPMRSPYLSAARPTASGEQRVSPTTAFEPAAAPEPEPTPAPEPEPRAEAPVTPASESHASAADAWSPSARVAPPTAPTPLVHQAEPAADTAETRMPTRPTVPGTGSMPTVARTPFASPAAPEPLASYAAPAGPEAPAPSQPHPEEAAPPAQSPWIPVSEEQPQRRTHSAPQEAEPPRFAFTEPPRPIESEPVEQATVEPETSEATPVPLTPQVIEPEEEAEELPTAFEPDDSTEASAAEPPVADEPVAPTFPEPTADQAPSTPGWGTLHPEPIEIEDDEDVVAPVPPPPASEILPTFEVPEVAEPAAPLQASAPLAPAEGFRPEPADPVRELGASAVSNASLQAAGAPTPASGVPIPGQDTLPAFGEEQPFVPRFEPIGGVTPSDRPSVSFQAPTPRAVSPLTNLELPDLDEPAYQPLVDLAGNGEGDDESDHPVTGEMPALRPEDLAPQAIEQVTGDAEAVAVSDAPASSGVGEDLGVGQDLGVGPDQARGSGPATPMTGWPYRADAESELFDQDAPSAGATDEPESETPGASDEVEAGEAHVPPFRRAGALDLSDADEAPFTPLPSAPQFDDILAPSDEGDDETADLPVMSWAAVLGTDADDETPSEPIAPTEPEPAFVEPAFVEPAYTEVEASPEPGAAEATAPLPAIEDEPTYASAMGEEPVPVTRPLAFAAPVGEDGNDDVTSGAGGDEPAEDEEGSIVTDASARKKSLLWLWITLGAVVVAGLAVAAYFAFLRPDAEILPTPTVTAEAPEPTAAPVAYVEPSTFLAQLPDTVGTDVLVSYTATDTVGDDSLPARAAEHYTLEYGPGSGNVTSTVEAYQHYTADEAQAAYDAYADGAIDVEDVTVDGAVVGERAYFTEGSEGTVVWRNNTAVFVLTGAADDVLHFYEHYGV